MMKIPSKFLAWSAVAVAAAFTAPVAHALPEEIFKDSFEFCTVGQASDLDNFTRQCISVVTHSNGAPQYNGAIYDYETVFGPFSGDPGTYQGQAAIISVGKHSYVSMQLVAPAHTAKLSANVSWGAGGAISVSTKPGIFQPNSPYLVPNCFQQNNGTNNMIISANGLAGVPCQITAGEIYYINIADTYNGLVQCTNPVNCSMSYTPLVVN